MILALLAGCAALADVIVVRCTHSVVPPRVRSRQSRSREAAQAQRAAFVEANPSCAGASDVVAALRRDGFSSSHARLVTDHGLRQGIKPFTLWLWLARFGGEALSIVVVADLTQHELLSYISDDTVPDLGELKIFASANDLD